MFLSRQLIFSFLLLFPLVHIPAFAKAADSKPKKAKRLSIKKKRVKTKKAALKYLSSKKVKEEHYDNELIDRIKEKDFQTATALVLAGATLNRAEDQESPLHLAAQYADPDLLEIMLKHGADLNHGVTQKNGPVTGIRMNALFFAVQNNNKATLEYLHQKGLDIQATDSSPHFPQTLMQKAAMAGSLECFQYLHENGGNILHRYALGASYLHAAARFGHLELVKYIVSQGIDINTTTNADITPIMWAGVGKHAPIIRYLAEQGAQLNIQDNWSGNTVMHFVAQMNDASLFSYLKAKGAHTDIKNKKGITAADIWDEAKHKLPEQ